MTEKKKYKIREGYDGLFTIFVYASEITGYLWWAKKTWSWYYCDENGDRSYMGYRCKIFITLSSARDRVKRFKEGEIIHKCD